MPFPPKAPDEITQCVCPLDRHNPNLEMPRELWTAEDYVCVICPQSLVTKVLLFFFNYPEWG